MINSYPPLNTDIATKVSACKPGYFLSSDKTTCTACSTYLASVLSCTSATVINLCASGY